MYSKAELSAKAHIELIDIAKEMGIAKATRLDAHELVYKILDHQASNPTANDHQQNAPEHKQHRKREHLKPKLLAESTVKNPELHNTKKNAKKVENNNLNVEKAERKEEINISDVEMPVVPELPGEWKMESGKWKVESEAESKRDAGGISGRAGEGAKMKDESGKMTDKY